MNTGHQTLFRDNLLRNKHLLGVHKEFCPFRSMQVRLGESSLFAGHADEAGGHHGAVFGKHARVCSHCSPQTPIKKRT